MKLSNLANVLRAAGLTVVESPGWATRGYAGQDLAEIRGILWHHTATNRAAYAKSNAPTLAMCLNGRPDLPPPLCNIVFARDGTVHLAAAGVANHAGAGSAPGIPKNMGNHYLIGIEMESSGVAPWDWTEDQIRVAPHLGAALERAYLGGIPEDLRLQLGHKEYSSQGKIDPAGWPGDMDGLRASINAVLNGSAAIAPQGTTTSKDWFDMASEADLRKVVKAEIAAANPWGYKNPNLEKDDAYALLRAARTYAVKSNAELAALKDIVGQLAKAQGTAIDYARVDAIVKDNLAAGVTVDVNVNGNK